jgi:hypothetical protein
LAESARYLVETPVSIEAVIAYYRV